jgi:hypothetical protein
VGIYGSWTNAGFGQCTFWQYGQGSVAGIGTSDVDVFHGTADGLKELALGSATAPKPTLAKATTPPPTPSTHSPTPSPTAPSGSASAPATTAPAAVPSSPAERPSSCWPGAAAPADRGPHPGTGRLFLGRSPGVRSVCCGA